MFRMQKHFPLGGPFTGSLCGSVGSIRNMSGAADVALCDKYYLGGPLALRGFSFHGVGPRVVGTTSALGGLSRAYVYAMVDASLPKSILPLEWQNWAESVKSFVFLNAGGTCNGSLIHSTIR